MKTTKDAAEMLCAEMERVQNGEVRKDAIAGLTRLTDGLIKLARLEMDFAFRNWGEQPPAIPWIASKATCQSPANEETLVTPGAVVEVVRKVRATPEIEVPRTVRGQNLWKDIQQAEEQLATATPTMKKVLTDKIKLWRNKLAREQGRTDASGDDGQ